MNPAYEFDNLSEKQVHVGSGKCKNRSGDGRSCRGAPSGNANRLAVRGVRTGSDAASVFRASRRGGARGPVTAPAGQVNAWSVGNAIPELMLTKLSHLHGS